MSLAILHCRGQRGVEAPPVTIEVFLTGGLPVFTIVGMAETAVRESKDRVRGALIRSGFDFPQQRITVSLGPADMRKAGGRYDLAIALGILAARKQLPLDSVANMEFYGELALSGMLRPVPGLLPAALSARDSARAIVVPTANQEEAALGAPRFTRQHHYSKSQRTCWVASQSSAAGERRLQPKVCRTATCLTSKASSAPSGRSK